MEISVLDLSLNVTNSYLHNPNISRYLHKHIKKS